jgi:diguanylate cyclase (GGDEF)-like protein
MMTPAFDIRPRLLLTGIAVVVASMAMSLVLTHLSFVAGGSLDYPHAMMMAGGIPLLIAPIAYGYIAVLTARLHHANRRLDHLARHDVLTGLLNRRAFVEDAEAMVGAERRLWLLMADVDHFKRINDTLGHAAGDAALRHVAAALRDRAPPGAIVARIGGEEFAILVPGAGQQQDGIREMTDRLRADLRGFDLPGQPLTCSFGLAMGQQAEALDTLLARSDGALYQAKQDGRDRMAAA